MGYFYFLNCFNFFLFTSSRGLSFKRAADCLHLFSR